MEMEVNNPCPNCGNRSALITGRWYYEPDKEPYQSGVEEEAKTNDGDAWLVGYKCDDCGTIHNISFEHH